MITRMQAILLLQAVSITTDEGLCSSEMADAARALIRQFSLSFDECGDARSGGVVSVFPLKDLWEAEP